jgi:nucleoside-diphosphate-sugar epimerase
LIPSKPVHSALEKEDLELMLNARPDVWEELAHAGIFLTGATGFFGKWLLSAFQYAFENGKFSGQLMALSRNPDRFLDEFPIFKNSPYLTFIQGDVQDFLFPEGHFDFVIHAATEASVSLNLEKPIHMFEVAAMATRRVLDFAVQAGAKRFLLTSSGAVYGNQPSEITHLPENYSGAPDVLAQNAAYGEGKRVAEMFCNFYSKQFGLEVLIARCYAFAGPFLPIDSHFAIGNFVRDYLQGGPIRIGGDGSPFRSYLYAADLVVWLLSILVKGKSGQAYNLGSDQDLDIEALARKVAHSGNKNVSVEIAQVRNPGKPVARYVPSVEKAKNELGLKIYTSLDVSISRMIRFYAPKFSTNTQLIPENQ